uniref:DNA ligase n=2 Tax=unclassified bacterial viruses TaxID=12333 RepID=A0AAU6W121_9VIRU
MKRLVRCCRTNFKGWVRSGGSRAGEFTLLHNVGVLVNWRALWVGAHYSPAHKRLCINFVPCVTVWWAKPGGYLP